MKKIVAMLLAMVLGMMLVGCKEEEASNPPRKIVINKMAIYVYDMAKMTHILAINNDMLQEQCKSLMSGKCGSADFAEAHTLAMKWAMKDKNASAAYWLLTNTAFYSPPADMYSEFYVAHPESINEVFDLAAVKGALMVMTMMVRNDKLKLSIERQKTWADAYCVTLVKNPSANDDTRIEEGAYFFTLNMGWGSCPDMVTDMAVRQAKDLLRYGRAENAWETMCKNGLVDPKLRDTVVAGLNVPPQIIASFMGASERPCQK